MEPSKKSKELAFTVMTLENELMRRHEVRGQFRSIRWMICVIATVETVEYATTQHHGLPAIIACIACAIGSHLVLIHNENRLNLAQTAKTTAISDYVNATDEELKKQ